MGAVTLLCVFQVKFLRLSSDASHGRGGGLGETALPRGKSVLFVQMGCPIQRTLVG